MWKGEAGKNRSKKTTWELIAAVQVGADGGAVGGMRVPPYSYVEALTLPV